MLEPEENNEEENNEDAAKAAEEEPGKDLESELNKWKTLSRKNEERAKSNAVAAKKAEELQKRLDEIEAANMSELEKAQKEATEARTALEAAQAVASAAELSNLRMKIGTAKGLPAAIIDRLVGDDEEAIAADAEKLVATLKEGQQFPDFGQGKGGDKPGMAGLSAFEDSLGLKAEGDKKG